MSNYQYADQFFDFVSISSGRSAMAFLRDVQPKLAATSVLDVGCGQGVWLAAWRQLGVTDVLGLDGAYVDVASLKIPADNFKATDVAAPFELGRMFDLVECLEVAEHINPAGSDDLVDNLVRHGDRVMFSAAIPGQGGEHHVNERPIAFWADKFRARGYSVFDYPRQAVKGHTDIEPWYRFNTMLYVKSDKVDALPAEIRATEIAAGKPIPDYAPLGWRVRCTLLSFLPQPVVHKLALIKHQLVIRTKRS